MNEFNVLKNKKKQKQKKLKQKHLLIVSAFL